MNSTSSASQSRVWEVKEIRDLVERVFKKRPCWSQIKVALTLDAGKDVVACAPTGAGHSNPYWRIRAFFSGARDWV